MAFEPGGYADKLGNRYEGRWIARQLLLLLHEQIRSVRLEPVGDDEAGVDLWIERADGKREAQQCKAENGTKAHWTLNDLKARGVLGHLRSQLHRDPQYRFTFVSSSPAPQLRDLSRSAMDSTGDAESFYTDQIQAGSRDRQAGFSDWCKVFDLNELGSEDRAMAFDLLRRSGFHQFSDTGEERESLKLMAKQAVIGDADTVLALLSDFAADNPRKTIIAAEVCQHLLKSGYKPRKLFADERIGPRLDELRADFDESICPHLAGGKLIARPEVDEILTLLDDDSHTDAIILHGTAGHGKSGVLYQLTLKLRERGTPFLALRLDRKIPAGSPQRFGLELGLPESPVNCLDAVSSDHASVLILDQLDALRWTSSHATEGVEVCKGLLREVLAMRMVGRRISIVFCCRTFDLEHDPQIRAWLKPSKDLAVKKVAVVELPEAKVREFVESFNVNFARMTPRRQSLLRSVQNLAIWAEVVQSEAGSPEFDSGTDLMRAFWSNRRKEIEKAGFAASERDAFLDRLIDDMESRAALSAPRRLIERHEGLATELQTLNVIHVERRSVLFCHQSYLDFLIASRVLDQLTFGSEAIVAWLGNRSQQSLFRREQLRQLLFLIAEEKPLELSSTLDLLLASDALRFHIKQLAIEAIGQLRPSPALIAHVITMSESERWRDHVIRDVVHGSVDWMNAFHESGRLFDWLLSSDVSNQNTAVWLMNSVAETMPSLIEAALAAAKEAGITERLCDTLLFSKAHEVADAVFEFRLNSFGSGAEPPYIAWKEVAERRPDRAIHLLATLLKKPQESRVTNRYGRRLPLDSSNDIKALMNAASRCPKLTVRLLIPVLTEIAKRKLQERRD